MTILQEALENFLNWLQQHRPEYAAYLKPGLTCEQIRQQVEILPFQLPHEVFQLYQWRNGTELDYFLPYYYFLPLEEAIEQYHVQATMLRQQKEQLEQYYPQATMPRDPCNSLNLYWFPIFYEPIEQLFVVGHDEQRDSSPVIYYFGEDGSSNIFCSNLTTMILTMADCYKTGAYYYMENPNRVLLEEDTIEVARILRQHNPNLVEDTLTKAKQAYHELSYQKLLEIAYRVRWYKDSRTVEPLIGILQASKSKNKNSEELHQMQSLAAALLGELNDPGAVSSLIKALQAEDWVTRLDAAKSLGKLGQQRAIAPLVNALDDNHELVRNAAASSLLFGLNAVEPLIEALKSNSVNVRSLVAQTLGA
ncbi:MAG: HEAT repeat domain-containing protein, partial [Cyanobacteriota bacterium]|nr:HEAT repeat domain-containing protein [Cyanobacteriota bacterium]